METKESTIKVCEGLYSTSIYEMDVWTLPSDNEDNEEDYIWQLENVGHMDCGLRRGLTGLFRTKEPGHWGIVWGTPMTPEQYEKVNERINQGHDGDTMARKWRLDWSDDNYTILINADGAHEHIPAHHVLPHDERIPNFVCKTLMEGLRRAEED